MNGVFYPAYISTLMNIITYFEADQIKFPDEQKCNKTCSFNQNKIYQVLMFNKEWKLVH